MHLPFASPSKKTHGHSASPEPNHQSGYMNKWNHLRQSMRPPPALPPLPKAITDQLSTEIYELIMDHLDDKPSLLACNLVGRAWAPRSRCLLLERMVCHPAPLVAHGGFGVITCAAPDPFHRRRFSPRLLSIKDVSQIEILVNENLVICLAGGSFMTISLNVLNSGTCQETHLNRISKHVSCFTVHRSTAAGESHRICALKSSALSGTLKVYDVVVNNQVTTLVPASELYIPLETFSVRFLSRIRLVAAINKGFAVQGGFEMVDLVTAETQGLLDPDDPSHVEFALKKLRPMAVFRVDTVFLVCYDKLAFYIDRRGNRTQPNLMMRWTQPANAFALHEPYILAFCNLRVEVWNIETGTMAQTIQGPFYLLNAPDSGEKVLGLSLSSGEVTEIVFHDHALHS
ncbi:CNH domain-containing protein [Mycena olivaceomarginata]|nr:CNH domain-containing protein [Mycena olivaceomarginata]